MDIELERRRIIAAFGLARKARIKKPTPEKKFTYEVLGANGELFWHYSPETGDEVFGLGTENGRPSDHMLLYHVRRGVGAQQAAREYALPMAKGLFKLGRSIEKLEEHFGPLLTPEVKLECRQEMPRELWPAAWVTDEPT